MKNKLSKAAQTVTTLPAANINETTQSAHTMQNPSEEQISPKQLRPKIKPKAKSSQKRKRRHSSSSNTSSCEDGIDPAMEEKLKQSALRNNLTHENVKNILQKVVRNDHVLAIVKLQEEEEMEKDKNAKKLLKLDQEDDDDASAALPKLTRAMAKALNLPVAPLKNSLTDSDVVALISEELRSDDDDEEYQPGEDDIETDDDINTTASDIDSQPRTPQTPLSHIENDDESTLTRPAYTTDGLFKIPRARNESTTSQSEQEYIIAQQTRSKVSLAETPIEAIESTFNAPDVPLDMYENIQCDGDYDHEWFQFLFDFSMPFPEAAPDHEKDEDGDPDYIAADKAPVDKEELRQVKVSKKELQDLLNEFNESIADINWNDGNLLLPPPGDETARSPLSTPVKSNSCSMATASTKIGSPATPTVVTVEAPIASQTATPSPFFDPMIMSTPMHSSTMPNGQFDNTAGVANNMGATLATSGTESYPHAVNPFKSNSTIEPLVPHIVPIFTLNTSLNNSMLVSSPQFIFTLPVAAATASTSAGAPHTQINLPLNCLNRQIEAGGLQKHVISPKRTRFKKVRFNELENLDPKNVVARKTINPASRGFSSEQRLILEQQLRMHVQLTTQNYMQTYGHPEHYTRACKFKRFLIDLEEINNNRIVNLKPALALIAEWETEISIESIENTELIHHIRNEMEKLRKNARYEMRFHERWLRKLCFSNVFIYPKLLPSIPFRFDKQKISEFLPSEDYLIAFELERYFVELTEKTQRYKLSKPKEVSLALVCKYISANLCYLRSAKSIYDYVRVRKARSYAINPIKFYFMYKRAPTYEHQLIPFDEHCIIEPAKRTLHELPNQFAKFVEKLIGYEHDKLISSFLPINQSKQTSESIASAKQSGELVKTVPPKRYNYCSNTAVGLNAIPHSNSRIDNNDKSISIEVNYRNVCAAIHSCHNECETLSNQFYQSKRKCFNCSRCDADDLSLSRISNECISKGQTLLTSYFTVLKKSAAPSSPLSRPDANYENVECNAATDEVNIVQFEYSEKTTNIYRFRLKIVRKYLRLNYHKNRRRHQLQHKFNHIIRKSKHLYTKCWQPYRRQPFVLFTFLCIDTYRKFTGALFKMNGSNAAVGSRRPVSNIGRSVSATTSKSMSIDVIAVNKRVQKIVNDINGGTITDEANAKRLSKGNKTAENARMMLLCENQLESAEKDCIFAQHYFDRVEETFVNENNHQKLNEFLSILRCFDYSKENGGHLYLKLEKLFAPDHSELADLFLNFLLPSDATEIGKFMEHFLYTNMAKFINRLHLFYQKQPAQMRKVLACLKELAEEEDIKMDKIRNKIVPVLKGNQLLIDWFLQCLGNETAVPSGENTKDAKDEYETISFRKAADAIDDDAEAYEHIPQSEIFPDPNDNPCHIRYMNGRLFYGNRLSFPAKLSFSAVNTSPAPPTARCTVTTKTRIDHEREYASIACASYRCVHDIKEFGNMKIQIKSRNPMEIDQTDNSATEEGEDSEDEQQADVKLNAADEKSTTDKISETTSMHLLCDDKMLKAHGIRLNPSAHSSVIYNNAEMLNMLKPSSECASDGHREGKLSPKKQALNKCTPTAQTKLQRKCSPNAKKTNGVAQSSSPNRKFVSPPSVPMHTPSAKLTSDSPAIQTAKKLKRILETCSAVTVDDKNDNTVSNAVKRNLSATQNSANKIRRVNRTMASSTDTAVVPSKPKPIKLPTERTDEEPILSETKEPILAETSRCNQSDSNGPKKNEPEKSPTAIIWSRDEDRLLLEHIKDGLESNYELITQITHEFPTKTTKNIEERIDFLIDFLTKLRNIT